METDLPLATADDETLAERCRDTRRREAQDEEAWTELKRRFQNLVRWKIIAMQGPLWPADVDDCAAEVWLKLVQEIFRYDRRRGRFTSFLLSLTHNLVADARRVRQRERQRLTPLEDNSTSPLAPAGPPLDLLETVVVAVDRNLRDPRERLIFGELQAGERVAAIARHNRLDPSFVRRTRHKLEKQVADLLQEILPG